MAVIALPENISGKQAQQTSRTSASGAQETTPAPPGRRGSLESALVKLHLVDERVLAHAGSLSPQSDLGSTLVSMGVISEEQLCQAQSELSGLPVWDGEGTDAVDDRFDPEFLASNHVLPVETEGHRWLVIEDAEDDGLHDMLRQLAPEAQLALFPHSDLAHRLQQHPQVAEAGEAEASDDLSTGVELGADQLKDLALEAPTIRLVNDIINSAVRMNASDIHLEPYRRHVELRYRIDGALASRPAPTIDEYPAVVSRIKILADLDIAERRLPQDGRIRTKSAGRDIDIRVSTMPAPFGEDIVLRLLDQKRQVLSLKDTGLSDQILERFRASLGHHNGIILVTGPTGSGKTTTLYSALDHIIDGQRKIITVEDPVEFEIAGITQTPVNESIGMSFAKALRSILRHDPDIIFIGEIRDRETADIAIQAALTGHLVLSTLHTNNAVGAITRFLDMGVPDYLLASSMLAVTAQRLVRRLCPDCRQPAPVPAHFAERFALPAGQTVFEAAGCSKCAQTGFRGRIPIAEFKAVNPQMRTAIVQHPGIDELEAAAAHTDPEDLLDDGIRKVLAGVTTFEEVIRIAG